MSTVSSGTSGYQERDHSFRITIFGDSSVGKSALVRHFFGEPCTGDYVFGRDLRMGRDVHFPITSLNEKKIGLELINYKDMRCRELLFEDVRGQHARLLFTHYMIAFDITDRDSFNKVQKYFEITQQIKSKIKHQLSEEQQELFKVIVVGCKSDLEHKRAIDFEEAKAYCDSIGSYYIETSAKTGKNVTEAFHMIPKWVLTGSPLSESSETRKLRLESHRKKEIQSDIDRLIGVLMAELVSTFAVNRQRKLLKIEALRRLKDLLSAPESAQRTLAQTVHAFRTTDENKIMDQGIFFHRTRNMLDKYDTLPAAP